MRVNVTPRRSHGRTRTDYELIFSRTLVETLVVVYYKDESECNAQMDAHAQRPRHQDNIQAQHQIHQTHRLRQSMGKESVRGESR